MTVLLIFGLCGIACGFILLASVRLFIARVREGGSLWRDSYFWMTMAFGLVAFGLLEFCVMRVWQALFTGHIPFVQSPLWALLASTTILAGLCAKMRVLSLNNPSTGRKFIIASAAWSAFVLCWGLL